MNADVDSPGAVPFYLAQGATAINPYWYQWDDITTLVPPAAVTGDAPQG